MFTSISYVSILMVASTTILTCSVQCDNIDNLIVDFAYRDTLVTDEDIFCWSRNSDRFIYSASLESNGCQIRCTFWASSSPAYYKFYNTLDTVHYNKSDNTPCKGGSGKNVCKSGACIDKNNLPGQAMLTLVSGYFPDQDYFSATDCYIEVFVKPSENFDHYINLGSTRVIEDDNSPDFGTTFTSPIANKSGHFRLVAHDRDSSPDDYICSFRIKFNSCKENDLCELSNGSNSISYKLKWISTGN